MATGEKKVSRKKAQISINDYFIMLISGRFFRICFPQEIIRGGDLEGFSFFDDDAVDVV